MKKQTRGKREFNRWFKNLQKIAKANGRVAIVALRDGKLRGRWAWKK